MAGIRCACSTFNHHNMKDVLKWLLGGGGPVHFVVVSLRVVLDNTNGDSCLKQSLEFGTRMDLEK